jgi:hypothetical protein
MKPLFEVCSSHDVNFSVWRVTDAGLAAVAAIDDVIIPEDFLGPLDADL